VVTDVAIAKDVERMVAHAIETFGRLDFAVNNAGIEGKLASITDLPEQEWDRVLDTNLKGTFLCLQYEARAMLAGGHGGAIVNVGSVNSFLGFPTGSAYALSLIHILIFQLKESFTIVIVTHNMQQASRVAEFTGFFLLGELIEFDKTERIFTTPSDKRTEDYITGRFG